MERVTAREQAQLHPGQAEKSQIKQHNHIYHQESDQSTFTNPLYREYNLCYFYTRDFSCLLSNAKRKKKYLDT